jgi:AcrR family transcriptional regulator
MGRKSLAGQRSAEILDAVEVCLVKYGLERTTLALIAEEAGMATSIIRHYLGDKNAVIKAAVERSLANMLAAFDEAMDAAPPEKKISVALDVAFDAQLAVPEVNQLIDELVAHSYFDEFTRERLRDLYRELQEQIREALVTAYPEAKQAQVEVVVQALLALGHAGQTFAWIGFDRSNDRKLRTAAETLIATLRPPA